MSFAAAIAALMLSYVGYTHTPAGQQPPPDAVCHEDMACWDCETMGNLICGPVLVDDTGLLSDGSCVTASPCAYARYTPEEIDTIDPVWNRPELRPGPRIELVPPLVPCGGDADCIEKNPHINEDPQGDD